MKLSELADRLMVVAAGIAVVWLITFIGHCEIQSDCLGRYGTQSGRSAADCGVK